MPRDGPLRLESRTDAPAAVEVVLLRDGEVLRRVPRRVEARGFSWSAVDLGLARAGDRIEIWVVEGPWRSFHHRFAAPSLATNATAP